MTNNTNQQLRLRRRFFWLALLVGALPLGLQTVLWLRSNNGPEGMRAALVSTAIGVPVLVVLSWLVSRRLFPAITHFSEEVRSAADRLAGGDFGTRIEVAGPGKEFVELSTELNEALESSQRQILNLRLEVNKSIELRESSRHLIEDCIYAREPLAKQHPGLATGYARAVIRKAVQSEEQSELVKGLVSGVDAAVDGKVGRKNLRWSLKDVKVNVPLPAKLVNMSVSGMAVESKRGLPVGGQWVFRVETDARVFDIPGIVRWCRLSKTIQIAGEFQAVYQIGIAFDQKLTVEAFDQFSPAAFPSSSRNASA